jgi:hypothetical protein
MQRRPDIMAPHRVGDRTMVADIAFNERPPFDEVPMPSRQIVERHRHKPSRAQRLAGLAADVPSAADNKNRIAGHCERGSAD